MGLRTWTAAHLEEGETLRWLAALGIKLGIELTVALLIGYALTRGILFVIPLDAIQAALGATTVPALWMLVSTALFWRAILCKYTEPLSNE